jgi:PmbA protein
VKRSPGSRVRPVHVAGEVPRLERLVDDVLARASGHGADAAEVGVSEDAGLSVSVRLGQLETVEFNHDRGFGITVYFDGHKGSASTSDTTPAAVAATVKAACDIARFTAADPCNGLAEAERMARVMPDLDLDHPWGLSPDDAEEIARASEAAARAFDARIVNSEGAAVTTHQTLSLYGNSHGFRGSVLATRHSQSCAVIASAGDGMQRGHWYTLARDAHALESCEAVGRAAARRAVAKLAPRRVPTGRYGVLFAPETAVSLIGHLIAALSGGALYRRASFLVDSIGRRVLPRGFSLIERPHLPGALGSAAFDADGVATSEKSFVADGVIASYVLGTYSARRLGLVTTGNAGGVHNPTLEAPRERPTALLERLQRGLLVTELMGQGVNLVTGDYSRGVAGFWVEDGAIVHPVEEITVAGNLATMLEDIVAVGDDVDPRFNVRCGSLLIDEMTVAAN